MKKFGFMLFAVAVVLALPHAGFANSCDTVNDDNNDTHGRVSARPYSEGSDERLDRIRHDNASTNERRGPVASPRSR